MSTPITRPSLPLLIGSLTLSSALLLACTPSWAASATARQFQQWSGERWISRSISLAELGFTAPAVLDNGNGQREFYVPVPGNVALSDASLDMQARYLRADGGRTSMTVSIDGYPVAARRFTEDQGDASATIAVDGLPRNSGFVRVGINWSSVLSDQVCTDQRAPGNSLNIAASTRFSYKYERSAIATVATAWGALPQRPVLLVAARGLSAPAFDTAWRTGVALERNGKQSTIQTLPALGDSIDLSRTEVPAALHNLPAFAALGDRNRQHRIKDLAELGALLALGQHGPLQADLVITDPALLSGLRQAFDALSAQVKAQAPDAADALAALLASNFSVLEQGAGTAGQIRVAQFGGNPAIAIPASSAAKAATLLGSLWRPAAAGQALTVNQAALPKLDGDSMLLSQFGALAGSLDVLARAERSVVFDLGAVAGDGRLPDQLSIDVAAAPSVNGETPVASVFVNDYLLGAKKLLADGSAQRMTMAIPRYALSARNTVRIAFLRQPSQLHCHDQPLAFPVSILPGSHLRLGKAGASNDFIGMAGKFAAGASLLVPDSWLKQPASSLPQVIRMADAAGLPTATTSLQLIPDGQDGKPGAPFLALDVALAGYQSGVQAQSGKLVLNTRDQQPLLDLAGIDRVASAEVIKASGQDGIAYRNIGKQAPSIDNAFRLTRGNLALLGDAGPLLQLDLDDPHGANGADNNNPQSLGQRHMTL